MYTVIATLNVKAGKMEEALQILREDIPKMKQSEPGCLAYIPHTVKGDGNGNMLVFYEKYADKEALKLHSQNLPSTLGRLLPLLDPGMDIKTCVEAL
jgi:quinol monooxygenase YgiN